MLFGFTTKSTLVTLNGNGVGEGVDNGVDVAVAVGVEPAPLLPLLPQAAKMKVARQMNTTQGNRRTNIFFGSGCFNIISPKKALNTGNYPGTQTTSNGLFALMALF
jgi:hypothetical protein